MTDIENSQAVVQDTSGNELICDRSGVKARKGGPGLRETWDGLMVLPQHWEPRHPQDFVRAKQYNNEGATSIRPRQTDQFVNGSTWNGSSWDLATGGVSAVSADDL
jgi:hypothetical protein